MGIEGSVRLGFRKELEATAPGEREALFARLVAAAIERGQALKMASHLEIDDVIDPAQTRAWLHRVLTLACAAPLASRARIHRCVVSWSRSVSSHRSRQVPNFD